MLVGDPRIFKGGLELLVEHFLEQILEPPIIGLENCVLGREVDGPLPLQSVIHACTSKTANRFIVVVHSHGDPWLIELHHLVVLDFSPLARSESHRQRSSTGDQEICRSILVTMGVATDDDRLGPAGNQARYIFTDDGFAENGAADDVSNGSVGRTPHLF